MEAEEAWDLFRSSASADLRKSASVAGQLDTMAAQIQDIQTGVDRITKLIPQFMGDDAAISDANANAVPPENPLEGFAGDMGGDDMGGEMPDEGGMPEEGAEEEPSEENDMDKADEDGQTNEIGTSEDIPEEDDDRSVGEILGIPEDMPEDDGSEPVEDVGEDANAPEEMPEMAEAEVEEEIPPEAPEMGDGGDLNDIYAQILALLVQAVSKANDSGDAEALAGIQKSAGTINQAFGEMCPYLDSVLGTDHFTKSFAEVNGMSDDMEKCGSNTEGGLEKSITGAETPDDMIEKSEDAPAEFTDASADATMEKSAETKMHDVEDEKGAEPEKQDGPKLGPNDMSKSSHLMSFRDMLEKGCTNARVEDELEKDSIGDTLDEHIETGKKLEDAGISDDKMEDMHKSGGAPYSETKDFLDDLDSRNAKLREKLNRSKKDGSDMEKSADPNMPDVPEVGEDKSVSGTASENAPDVPEPGTDMSVTGSASTGVKPVIDPGSESSLEKSDAGTITQQGECDGALSKSIPGKSIPSIRDMMNKSYNNSRPDAISSANGDVTTPEFGAPTLHKSAQQERVRMGPGVDPHEVTKADWERYNLFKARGRF